MCINQTAGLCCTWLLLLLLLLLLPLVNSLQYACSSQSSCQHSICLQAHNLWRQLAAELQQAAQQAKQLRLLGAARACRQCCLQ
jgi:hypothetical protein